MGLRLAKAFLGGIAGSATILLMCGAAARPSAGIDATPPASAAAQITVDYPLNGSVFPPEITAPTILWHDPSEAATRWVVEITFKGHSETIRVDSAGEHLKMGHVDPKAGPGIELTPQQAATHTWKPDGDLWSKIKLLSEKDAATITIRGLADDGKTAVSAGQVTISTSADPAGAPIFYRDVPLMLPPPEEKGPITPLPQAALPLIKWRLRNLAEPESRTVMENLPTCANCHSFSKDGKTMGLDMDGPRNDKGLYALVPVQKQMTIHNADVLHWSAFQLNAEVKELDPAVKRFGFMSQISPDGRYVVTSIGPPANSNTHQGEVPGFAPGILDRLYSTNFRNLQFNQVFYPTKGILAWYDRDAKTMRPLPGADDPRYVHTSAFWSPDGKYLIFSRGEARDPYPPGQPKPEYANGPGETPMQYNLYKIPFNEGRGGTAVPVEGASNNGMSNDFPKVSPDGRWIVWVENKNGLLMRPDSRLFMVPFAGGKARLMTCNTALMNSWHTFSPNGRWLAFSSKARSPFTQLMMTHIDAEGNDTPAILVENMTDANRAVNIPEFVNIPEDGIERVNPQATEFYSLFDKAYALMENNQLPEAISLFREALERNPDDAVTHYVLATALSGNDQEPQALEEYRRACALAPKNATFLDHLAISLDISGDANGAVEQLNRAIALEPGSAEYRFNLGVVLEAKGDFAGAIAPLQKTVELSHGKNWRGFAELAKAYEKSGQRAEAIEAARKAVELAVQQHQDDAAKQLQEMLDSLEHEGAPAESR